MNKLKSTQDKAIRIISFKKPEDEVKVLYQDASILALEENTKVLKGKFMWKLLHNRLPQSIHTIFTVHGVMRKSKRSFDLENLKLSLPNQKSSAGLSFIIYDGTKFWNEVPNDITKCQSLSTFKNKMKKFLFSSL